jgi:hypothetical protein
MKACCILYHSNILSIYKKEWVEKSINSIINQTYQNFDIFELNYGDDNTNLKEMFNIKKTHFFYKIKMSNHAEAMNNLLDIVFKEKSYDICFNINLDDYYSLHRFEKQIEIIKNGFDLVSSEYRFIQEINNTDSIGNIAGLSLANIETLFQNDITPIAHPCVCYSKNFWLKYGPYIPNEIPREDKNLWVRSYNNGAKLYIIKDVLLFYRLHNKQVSNTKI